jgi:hypothetical protein
MPIHHRSELECELGRDETSPLVPASTEVVKVGLIKIRFEFRVLKVGPGILPERPMKQQ